MDPTRADRFAATDAGRAFAPPRRPAFSALRRAFVTRIGPAQFTSTLLSNHLVDRVERPLRAAVALVQDTSHVPQSVNSRAYRIRQRFYTGIVTHIKLQGSHAVSAGAFVASRQHA